MEADMVTAAQRERLSRYLGPLELRIMLDVWKHGPASVNDVLARLNRGGGKSLAYNTVMSTLARLADKGYLHREREGRAYLYFGDGADDFLKNQAAQATRELVEGLGSVGVAGVVEGLSATDGSRQILRDLLAEES